MEEEGRRKEEEGGERRAPNKAWPYEATALLIGIKWECIGHGLKGHIMDLTKSPYKVHAWRKEEEGGGEIRAPNKVWPYEAIALLIGIKLECMGHEI